MPEFSEEQLGKPVLDANGTAVGEVSDVRDGALWVTADEHADPAVLDELNWNSGTDRSTQRLRDGYVEAVDEDAITLRV